MKVKYTVYYKEETFEFSDWYDCSKFLETFMLRNNDYSFKFKIIPENVPEEDKNSESGK